jgi:hypothetical protein
MDMEERQRVQDAFAGEVRILISTDAGGEGLNLQFCHVVINYDIPWNPMRLEQRIGRVDRIGQTHVVRALNFVLEDTVEYRVQEVLHEKLAIILEEFGVDKTGDILDSAQAEQLFDDLYVEAILHPENLDTTVELLLSQVRHQAEAVHNSTTVLSSEDPLDPAEAQRVLEHPLPHWVEAMVTSYLRSVQDEKLGSDQGSRAEVVREEGRHRIWRLVWADGSEQLGCFTASDLPRTSHLGLEEPRVRGLASQLPRFAQGQPIPCLRLSGLPGDVCGVWSLWRIVIFGVDWNRQRILPLFVNDDGRILVPTARRVWDQLMSGTSEAQAHLSGKEAVDVFDRQWSAAHTQGKALYDGLVRLYREHLEREREKGEFAFSARRRLVERVGLPAVRAHRLTQLLQEERTWQERLHRQSEIIPELVPLIIVRVMSHESKLA